MTTTKLPTEHDEQVIFVRWFRDNFKAEIWAIPNGVSIGGGRNKWGQINKLKSEGLTNGIPDLFIPEWRLWVEMKRQKGGVLSDDQKEKIDYLMKAGYCVFVAKGADHAKQLVTNFYKTQINIEGTLLGDSL